MSIYGVFQSSLRWLLTRPITYAASRFSSAPDKQAVFEALTSLYHETVARPGTAKGTLLEIDPSAHRVFLLSDHHKGSRNGADDFGVCEPCYLAALDQYHQEGWIYINLGDSEELWENNILGVLKHNKQTFASEKRFIDRNAYFKIYGNHDSLFRFDPLAPGYLRQMYGQPVKVHGAILLRAVLQAGKHLDILCTHGHQGDSKSDGNWFSAWFVATIWGPLQSFLRINPNTPSTSNEKKSLHNQYMYEWSARQENTLLITGHTHQPVFASLTHLERLYMQLEAAMENGDTASIPRIKAELDYREKQYPFVNMHFKQLKPTYFNTGCCCFNNGNITGIEISDNMIRLVKWTMEKGYAERIVLEESTLNALLLTLEK